MRVGDVSDSVANLGTYSSMIVSSNLGEREAAWSQCSLIYHGWLISMECLLVSEEKWWNRSELEEL